MLGCLKSQPYDRRIGNKKGNVPLVKHVHVRLVKLVMQRASAPIMVNYSSVR